MGLRGFSRGIRRFYVLLLILTCQSVWSAQAHAYITSCPRLFEDAAPALKFELPGVRRDPTGARLKRLKVGHFSLNTYDPFPNEKSRTALQNHNAIVQTILAEKPDLLTLTEVMNREALNELSRRLDGIYQPMMIEGNSESQVAVLVRKSLPLIVELESHRNVQHWYFGRYEPLFTRDLALIHLSLPGATKPFLSIGANHFKAQKDNFHRDPLFKIKRTAQERGAVSIVDVRASMRGSRARIIMGDLQTDVRRSSELQYVKAAGYQDVLDVLGIPMQRRTSHSYFPREGTPEFWQTDAAFVSSEIADRNALVSGYIAADRNLLGQPLDRPRSIHELRERGSDHQMLVFEIDVIKLVR